MGLDIKSGLIAKDFADFAQAKLDTMFSGKQMRLGRIGASGLKNLAITDFSVSRKADLSPILSVDKIIVDYNLINLALRRFENTGKIYLISPTLFFDPGQTNGFVMPQKATSYLSGASAYAAKPLKFQILNGNISILGRPPILKNLEGQVSFHNARLSLYNVKGTFLDIPVVVNGRLENILERPVMKLRFRAEDRYYSIDCTFTNSSKGGDARFWGTTRFFDRFQTHFKGVVNVAAGQAIEIKKLVLINPFEANAVFMVSGNINISNSSGTFLVEPKSKALAKEADLTPPGYIKMVTSYLKGKGLSVHAKISHLNFFGHDILSEVNLSSGLHKPSDSHQILKGSLKTQNLIVDYKPFKEIELKWIVKNRELFINDFCLGDTYRMSGKVRLSTPYYADLALSINNAELTDWFSSSSGTVNGKIKMEGPLKALSTDGRINIMEGNINDVRFNAVNFNLKGKGPILTVSDSRILKEGGFLYMDGEVDLRKFGRRNILEDVKITTDQKVIVWEGWDITKSTSEIMAKKGISDNVDLNFKTYMTVGDKTGAMDEDDDKKSEIGLDYKIKKDDSINVRMKEDSAFVGVEHKMKF
jgi:hypothetical protein